MIKSCSIGWDWDYDEERGKLRFLNNYKISTKTLLNLLEDEEYNLQIHSLDEGDASDVFKLINTPKRTNMVNLKFSDIRMQQKMFKIIFESCWQKLKIIQFFKKPQFVNGCLINFQQIQNLNFSNSKLPALEELRFFQCRIPISKLFKAKWPMLKILSIYQNESVQEGQHIEEFEDLLNFPNLKELTLQGCSISELNLSKIDKSRSPKLEILDLKYSNVSGKLLFDLKTNIGWPELKQLYYGADQLTETDINIGLFNIVNYPFQKLKRFFYCTFTFILDGKFNKTAFKNMMKVHWPQLTDLIFCKFSSYLDESNFQQESLRILTKFNFPNLVTLTICNVQDQELNEIELNTFYFLYFPKLKKMDCYGWKQIEDDFSFNHQQTKDYFRYLWQIDDNFYNMQIKVNNTYFKNEIIRKGKYFGQSSQNVYYF